MLEEEVAIDDNAKLELSENKKPLDKQEDPKTQPQELNEDGLEEQSEPEIDLAAFLNDEGEQEGENQEKTPDWVKKTRKSNRRLAKENEKLKAELEALKKPETGGDSLGPEPTLESSNYDEDAFKEAQKEWLRKYIKIEEEKKAKEEAQKQQVEAFQAKVRTYESTIETLAERVPEIHDYQDEVVSVLDNRDKYGAIIELANNPALVVGYLGKNPKALEELAKTSDLAQYIYKLAQIEAKIGGKQMKTPPAPETRLRQQGSSQLDTSQKQLERLREKAAETGDYTEVNRYKQKMKAK